MTLPRVRWRLFGMQTLVVVAMLVLWQLSGDVLGMEKTTSSPGRVLDQIVAWHRSGVLWPAVWTTAAEALGGFALGAVLGAATGFVLGWSYSLGRILEPIIVTLYTAPKIAFAPLFVLWFGIDIIAKILFAALVVFFLVFFATFQGARLVDRDLLAIAQVMGAERSALWRTIALPHSAAWMFTGLRLGLPYALIGAVVAEFLAARRGLGFMIRQASAQFNTAGVFAGLVILMILATVFLALMQAAERHFLRWQEERSFETAGSA